MSCWLGNSGGIPSSRIAELRNPCTKLSHNRSVREKPCLKAALKHVNSREPRVYDQQQQSSTCLRLGERAARTARCLAGDSARYHAKPGSTLTKLPCVHHTRQHDGGAAFSLLRSSSQDFHEAHGAPLSVTNLGPAILTIYFKTPSRKSFYPSMPRMREVSLEMNRRCLHEQSTRPAKVGNISHDNTDI